MKTKNWRGVRKATTASILLFALSITRRKNLVSRLNAASMRRQLQSPDWVGESIPAIFFAR
ncbi:MAG: hypothetical protein DMC60_13320 [Verrucomicrobia bacterium]|nr:MAG: hypothetical protein DMC60_13320 [Verrucomicrobiota bacterium]